VECATPKVSEAHIKKPVAQDGKYAIDPYGKELGNKVSHDDSVVEADERNVKMAEKKLESEREPCVLGTSCVCRTSHLRDLGQIYLEF